MFKKFVIEMGLQAFIALLKDSKHRFKDFLLSDKTQRTVAEIHALYLEAVEELDDDEEISHDYLNALEDDGRVAWEKLSYPKVQKSTGDQVESTSKQAPADSFTVRELMGTVHLPELFKDPEDAELIADSDAFKRLMAEKMLREIIYTKSVKVEIQKGALGGFKMVGKMSVVS